MVFSSHLFVYYFLPLTLVLYYLSPRRARHLVLTFLSYAFYGWANPIFVVLMLFSTAVDFGCGLALDRGLSERGRRLAVAVSVMSNLGLLGFFKYFNFGLASYKHLVTAMGLEQLGLDTALRVALPLGISFYTFQSMSYTIDVYRGQARALHNFVDFACYVSLFPQLVAGPIIRFSEIDDQLASRTHTWEKFSRGAAFFSLGMAKKVLLANPSGKIADAAFDAASVEMLDAWLGLGAYSFQIYFDFSGYSDMAIGLGLMLGFVFPKNFDSPYKADSITDFWRRWHQSLSTWLRDYLYVPLGGNRRGRLRTYVNLMLVMLLGGLWHGASWNFVLWGGFHGLLLAAERRRGKRSLFAPLPRPLRVAGTYLLVLLSWILFRATDLDAARGFVANLVGWGETGAAAGLVSGLVRQPYALIVLVTAAIITWWAPQTWDWTRRLQAWKGVVIAALLWAALAALASQEYNPFIYFIF
jgi:alginate O-acetyltransferase complex protein AlgI